uniref:Uncharacterized protein n=1 Tax=Vitis vinifera TaxID=29760 RepID=F6I4V1_VITVI
MAAIHSVHHQQIRRINLLRGLWIGRTDGHE